MISIKHLRYFAALAQHRHFGRAADACAISQPALSLQIKDLEELLGAQLVERDRRQIRLTSLGEAFAGRAQQILRAVDELADLARASSPSLGGRLRIGMIPTVAPYLLPAVIRRLTERFPAVDLRPREAVTGKLTEDLITGGLDVAVMALPVSEPSLQDHPLFEEEFVLVRALADRLARTRGGSSDSDMKALTVAPTKPPLPSTLVTTVTPDGSAESASRNSSGWTLSIALFLSWPPERAGPWGFAPGVRPPGTTG